VKAVLALLAAGLVVAGCSASAKPSPPPPTPPPAVVAAPVSLKLLFTADEHGWVAPVVEKGRARGGSASLLARWRRDEGHCVPTKDDACEASSTIALSGGDNWTGPAISSFFKGEVAAEAMKRLGYSASALGNHELDFGRQTFDRNVAIEGFPYVAANVEPRLAGGGVAQPFVTVRRQGVTIAIVGLAFQNTPKVGLRDNYRGLAFSEEEAALVTAVPAAWKSGADAVVVIGHVCAEVLKPIIERHPDFHLAFVGGGHCHRTSQAVVAGTPIVEAGSFLHQYVRVTLTVDRSKAAEARVIDKRVDPVDLTWPESAPPPITPDADMTALVASWQTKADSALGKVLGHTGETFDADSPQLTNFITDRWRESVGADVALLNRFGTRQAIPKGPVKLETIYSVLPFDNRLVTVKLTGAQLLENVRCCHPHVSGLKIDDAENIVLSSGKPVDLAATYKVVTTDYAYFGGSDFRFEKQDPAGVFGDDWRVPLVKWLEEHPTREGKGLETLIDRAARMPPPKKERH
jgi:2',3'-cyclic-nucleotide 2'-phosphodiesterase (5'-nucleotidase family)